MVLGTLSTRLYWYCSKVQVDISVLEDDEDELLSLFSFGLFSISSTTISSVVVCFVGEAIF